MKRILIAPAAFKGSLSAFEAAAAIQNSLEHALNFELEVRICPIADGGDDTLAVLAHVDPDAVWQTVKVTGPLAHIPLEAGYLWLPAKKTIWIEAAQAHGLKLLGGQLAPMHATSLGVGELIRQTVERHQPQKLMVSLGGSASTDGGVGALQGLGFHFLNQQGKRLPIPLHPESFAQIARIIPPDYQQFTWESLLVATDVCNPLLGSTGAAMVFGPQKGASPAQCQSLEAALTHLAQRMNECLGQDLTCLPGVGTAGGLGYGLAHLPKTTFASGSQVIAEILHLQSHIDWADLIITGEGRFDPTSLQGKGTGHLIHLARSKPLMLICGQIEGNVELPHSVYPCSLLGTPESKAFAVNDPAFAIEACIHAHKEMIKTLFSTT